MNEYEATIQINPTDDIKRVHDAIDWSHLFERMAQMENETITATIDKLSDSMI